MDTPIPEQYVPLIVKALEHYYAYTLAVKRDDVRYQEAADWFKRKPAARSVAHPRAAKRKGR
jgi:hypothetical protein